METSFYVKEHMEDKKEMEEKEEEKHLPWERGDGGKRVMDESLKWAQGGVGFLQGF